MINWLENHNKTAIGLTLLVAIEIFYFSSLPGNSLGLDGSIWISRAYHIIVFFLLSIFLFASIKANNKLQTKQILLVVIIASLYALTDEIHQIFTPFRSCTFEDFMTDFFGIASAIILYLTTIRKEL